MLIPIALGSALGGVARYLVAVALERPGGMPLGTLVVNVTGSFLLGLLVRTLGVAPGAAPGMQAFATIGFCGGFTTFSTFSLEVARFIEQGAWGRAAGYAGASGVLSVGALFLGYAAASALTSRPAS